MQRKLLSALLAAIMVVGLLIAVSAPATANHFDPPPPASFLPDDDGVDATYSGRVLSDREDGQGEFAHLTAVAPANADRVEWRACPPGFNATTPTTITAAELSSCNIVLGVDNEPRTPAIASPLVSPDEAYDIKINITTGLDSSGTHGAPSNPKDVLVLACAGAGTVTDPSTGTVNCSHVTEENVIFDDAATGDPDTTTGEMFQICTRDDENLGGPNDAGTPAGDPCSVDPDGDFTLLTGAARTAVDNRFRAFEHGDPVPNEGFVLRVTTSPDLTAVPALLACRDLGGVTVTPSATQEPEDCDDWTDPSTQGAGDNNWGGCDIIQTFASHTLWECPFADAGAADDNVSQGIMIMDNAGFGTGFCEDADNQFCILDSHYSFSGGRRATQITGSFMPNAATGSPGPSAGCEPGETPDKDEPNPVGAVNAPQTENFEFCFRDQFGDPLTGRVVTIELGPNSPAGVELSGCTSGTTAAPNVANEPNNGCEFHDHNNDGFPEHLHALTDENGIVRGTIRSRTPGTDVPARPGDAPITGCADPEFTPRAAGGGYPGGAVPTQPAGHGCGDTTLKDTIVKRFESKPQQVILVWSGTGTAANPCTTGQKFKENTIGQSDTILVCTMDGSGNLATTNQQNGGQLQWSITTPTGQVQLATRFAAEPPRETGPDGTTTVQIQAVNEGTDFINVFLVSDQGGNQPNCAPNPQLAACGDSVQKRVRRPGETQAPTTQGGSPGPTTTTTTTATATSDPDPTATQNPRVITLEASKNAITFGKSYTLSGGITSQLVACAAGQTVVIRRTVGGTTGSVVFDTLTTNADGTFSKSYTGDRNANYIAHVDANGTCGEANSVPAPVNVRVKVDLTVSKQRVRSGARVRLTAKVAPCDNHAGTRITLFRSIGGSFGKVAKKDLNDACTARFRQRVRKSTVFQARWTKQDDDHQAGRSRKKAVRTRRS